MQDRNSSGWLTTCWRRWAKRELIRYKGAKCEKCGYDKDYLSSYDFHHVNQDDKDFSISKMINIRDMEMLKREVDKCLLLCSNCHQEIHEDDIPDIKESLNFYDDRLLNPPKRRVLKKVIKKICKLKSCGKEFVKTGPNQKYCSVRCSYKAQRKVKKRPSPEELTHLMETMPMVKIGQKYGVSDNAVRKWAKSYGLDIPRRKHPNSPKRGH